MNRTILYTGAQLGDTYVRVTDNICPHNSVNSNTEEVTDEYGASNYLQRIKPFLERDCSLTSPSCEVDYLLRVAVLDGEHVSYSTLFTPDSPNFAPNNKVFISING